MKVSTNAALKEMERNNKKFRSFIIDGVVEDTKACFTNLVRESEVKIYEKLDGNRSRID